MMTRSRGEFDDIQRYASHWGFAQGVDSGVVGTTAVHVLEDLEEFVIVVVFPDKPRDEGRAQDSQHEDKIKSSRPRHGCLLTLTDETIQWGRISIRNSRVAQTPRARHLSAERATFTIRYQWWRMRHFDITSLHFYLLLLVFAIDLFLITRGILRLVLRVIKESRANK